LVISDTFNKTLTTRIVYGNNFLKRYPFKYLSIIVISCCIRLYCTNYTAAKIIPLFFFKPVALIVNKLISGTNLIAVSLRKVISYIRDIFVFRLKIYSL